jgi:flagellar protein FliO/FliZ
VISQKIIRLSCSFLIIIFATLFVHQAVKAEENQTRSVAEMLEEQESPAEEVEIEPSEQEEVPLMEQENPFFLLLKLLFYLFVVIILIYGLIKFLSIRQRKMQDNQLFQSLGGTGLGQNKSLQLVRVGGQLYLLGVADQITLIKEIDDSTQISKIEGDLEKQDQFVSNSFIEFIQAKFKEKDTPGSTHSFSSLFDRSLQQQKDKRDQLENELYSYKTDEKEGRSL